MQPIQYPIFFLQFLIQAIIYERTLSHCIKEKKSIEHLPGISQSALSALGSYSVGHPPSQPLLEQSQPFSLPQVRQPPLIW